MATITKASRATADVPRTHESLGLLKSRPRTWLALGVIGSAAFYRSLTLWAINAWDLSSPAKILIVAASVAVLGVGVYLALTSLLPFEMPVALGLSGLILLMMSWARLPQHLGIALTILVLTFIFIGQKAKAPNLLDGLGIVFVIAVGLVPIVQLLAAFVSDTEPYPLADLRDPVSVNASGQVEDVVVLIVDTYPNLTFAESRLAHDPGALVGGLEHNGLSVASNAWSRHTFTSVSVSSILELQSVIDPGPKGPWENRSSLFRILRGDNFVSRTLQSAGFEYTHIASGWDGTTCGPTVDRCVASPWLDDQVHLLLSSTIAADWIESRHPFLGGTLNTANELGVQLDALQSNGSHDYVFAHFMLPHDPVLVDEECDPTITPDDISRDVAQRISATSAQMSCVDRLLTAVTEELDSDTAILLTGDHGTSTNDQVAVNGTDWSDQDIAERFGVLMAYKLPVGCEAPSSADPIVAMSALLTCSVGQELVAPPAEYLIGYEDPVLVDSDRMARIQNEVTSGR